MKKNITLPDELVFEVERNLVGKYYSTLSDVIRDGLRDILSIYGKKEGPREVAFNLYRRGEVTARQGAMICNLSLRDFLNLASNEEIYLQYGKKELEEDLA